MIEKYIKIVITVIIIAVSGIAVWYFLNRPAKLSLEDLSENFGQLDAIDDAFLPPFEMPLTNVLPPFGITDDFQFEAPELISDESINIEVPTIE